MVNLRSLTGGNQGIVVPSSPSTVGTVGEIESLRAFFYLSLVAALLCGLVIAILRAHAFGRALRTVRENERFALSLGLNAARTRLVAFAISGALAGIGGVLYAYQLKHMGPEWFGATSGIQIVLILLIGGARSAIGPILGAIVFFSLPEFVSIDPVSTQIFYGLALIAIVLISPDGVVPRIAEAFVRVWPGNKPPPGGRGSADMTPTRSRAAT